MEECVNNNVEERQNDVPQPAEQPAKTKKCCCCNHGVNKCAERALNITSWLILIGGILWAIFNFVIQLLQGAGAEFVYFIDPFMSLLYQAVIPFAIFAGMQVLRNISLKLDK